MSNSDIMKLVGTVSALGHAIQFIAVKTGVIHELAENLRDGGTVDPDPNFQFGYEHVVKTLEEISALTKKTS